MMMRIVAWLLLVILGGSPLNAGEPAKDEVLSSWNEGPSKRRSPLTQRGTNWTKKRFTPGIQAMRRGLSVRIAAFGTIILAGIFAQAYSQEILRNITKEELAKNNKLH